MSNEENVVFQKEKVEISAKNMGKDFKKFIKTNSADYLERLKAEVMKNLKVYYELINEQILEEQNNQELQQKNMKEKCDNNLKGNKDINVILSRRQLILFKLKEYKYLNDLKVKAFVSLYKNYIEEKNNNKKLHLVEKLIKQNKIKKIFRALKDQCLFQKNKEYEIKIQNKSKMELMKLNNDLNNQKQDLLLLISQAQERLKHENRKKIQVKLMLDQMVLRGISALNMQAMKLSQDSLKDVVNCDYKKEIDNKYNQMLFPESKATFVNSLK